MNKMARLVLRLYYETRFLRFLDFSKFCKIDELNSPTLVANQIRSVGLNFDVRGPYGSDNVFMNWHSDGLWQNPRQFAEALCLLSQERVTSAVEVGTSKGWTAVFMANYLSKFNKSFELTTIDITPQFALYKRAQKILPIRYFPNSTSEGFQEVKFELAFIDGDHSYTWVKMDYQNVGKSARIVMFHDIADSFVSDKPENNGGVKRFWNELKQTEGRNAAFHEFCYHSDNEAIMGIGIMIRR